MTHASCNKVLPSNVGCHAHWPYVETLSVTLPPPLCRAPTGVHPSPRSQGPAAPHPLRSALPLAVLGALCAPPFATAAALPFTVPTCPFPRTDASPASGGCAPAPVWLGLGSGLDCADALLAAMASSVYARGSALANTLNASRIGRYPVQRLQTPDTVLRLTSVAGY